eukprot:CAMPEP_0173247276 /NCGR_PEP_ID=MMETSP1142-20121109/17803_1 /TAXON_ID=483371 /ORGANISM="non described non described, Strain CCMP2298" /LENGTH=317 /DNA_ID=CAMNT_0014179633 /DNA_START=259 /DNA_END=1209 /DNA_ORIENTATION=+
MSAFMSVSASAAAAASAPALQPNTHETTSVPLPSNIGTQQSLVFHRFGPTGEGVAKVYIQASLHADELPGMLVARRLTQLLEAADKKGLIAAQVVVVPFANPIGLNQMVLGGHVGRFSIASGVNFNRAFADVTAAIERRIRSGEHGTLSMDVARNVRLVREAFREELDIAGNAVGASLQAEAVMKRLLLREACDADVVLDLHCDQNAVMHMYTHTALWPALQDLSAALGAECSILDEDSGGNCFDEACSGVWAKLAALFPEVAGAIPMACQSTTVELRGQYEVHADTAGKDAAALFSFLQRRGYVLLAEGEVLPPAP